MRMIAQKIGPCAPFRSMRRQGRGKTYNLRQVERVIADGVEDEVLKAVDDIEQLLTQRRHRAERRVGNGSWTELP
jgi:hypothetical protein